MVEISLCVEFLRFLVFSHIFFIFAVCWDSDRRLFLGSIAQLVEQLAVNQRVAGSNPAVSVLRSLYQAHREWKIFRR